jgi:hypothetical protein
MSQSIFIVRRAAIATTRILRVAVQHRKGRQAADDDGNAGLNDAPEGEPRGGGRTVVTELDADLDDADDGDDDADYADAEDAAYTDFLSAGHLEVPD